MAPIRLSETARINHSAPDGRTLATTSPGSTPAPARPWPTESASASTSAHEVDDPLWITAAVPGNRAAA